MKKMQEIWQSPFKRILLFVLPLLSFMLLLDLLDWSPATGLWDTVQVLSGVGVIALGWWAVFAAPSDEEHRA